MGNSRSCRPSQLSRWGRCLGEVAAIQRDQAEAHRQFLRCSRLKPRGRPTLWSSSRRGQLQLRQRRVPRYWPGWPYTGWTQPTVCSCSWIRSRWQQRHAAVVRRNGRSGSCLFWRGRQRQRPWSAGTAGPNIDVGPLPPLYGPGDRHHLAVVLQLTVQFLPLLVCDDGSLDMQDTPNCSCSCAYHAWILYGKF